MAETNETQNESKIPFLKAQDKRHGSAARPHRAVASQLRPGNLNTRLWETEENRIAVALMARNIFENTVIEDGKLVKSGVLEPIRVLNLGDSEPAPIDSGETRYRAVRLLEGFDVLTGEPAEMGKGVLDLPPEIMPRFALPAVPADVITFDAFYIDKATDQTERRFGVILANDQRPFTDLEWAAQFKALMTGDPENEIKPVPQNEIARRLGREATWVSHLNKLNAVPAELVPLLREGQISTTTVIEMIEEHGAEDAVKFIFAEIEAGKGKAAEEYEEAIAEGRTAQAEFERIANSPDADTPANPNAAGPRRLSKIEVARRNVHKASTKAERAKRQAKRGPDRVTGRAVKERAAASKNGAGEATGTVAANRANVDALLDAVRHAGRKSKEPAIRDAMNDALKRVGHAPVEPTVDDEGNELPVAGEVVETGTAAETGEAVEQAATA